MKTQTVTHTPAPWGPMTDGPYGRESLWEPWTAYMEAAPGLTIGSPANTEPICRVSGYLQPVEANARLIATAPEMLKALKAILGLEMPAPGEPGHVDFNEALKLARDAVAKAGGQQA